MMGPSGDRSPTDSMLPMELGHGNEATLQPEKRLLLAVLEGAVSDFQKYATALGGRGRRLFADADAWFASPAADQPCDFENICQALALDPSCIRAGLQRWCSTRRCEPRRARSVLHFPFRRVSGARHTICVLP
jgi:hypothetical protein